MASRGLGTLVLLAAAFPVAAADVDEDEVTDMEFLEYLGSWEGSDADWLLFEEPVGEETDEARTDEDSPEIDDED